MKKLGIQFGVCVLVYHPKTNEFVTVSRKAHPLQRCLPGGKVEKGETAAQAASRELFEETGLVVKPKHLIPIHAGISSSGKVWMTTFMIKLGKGLGDLDFDSPEGLNVKLMDQDDFMEVTAFPEHNERMFEAYHEFWDMVDDIQSHGIVI